MGQGVEVIRRSLSRHLGPLPGLGVLIVFLALPYLGILGKYSTYVLILALLYAMPATGLTLFMGYTGQLSIGHAAFYGVGAYVAANMTKAGDPFLIALLVAAMSSGVLGFVLGWITLRLRGFGLAMATLALGLVAYQVFKNFDVFTGGVSGLGQIPVPSIAGLHFNSTVSYYYLSLICLTAIMLATIGLVNSPTGRGMRAIASNELASQSLGINTHFIKSMVFALGAAYTGLAGGLYAHLIRYISPDDFSFIFSILFLTMAIVGGLRSVWGGLVGSLVVTFAAEALRPFPEIQPILYGALLILLILFMPYGVAGATPRVVKRIRRTELARRLFGIEAAGAVGVDADATEQTSPRGEANKT